MIKSKTIFIFSGILIALGCWLQPLNLLAQRSPYTGAPVKEDNLVKVLRSKEYQTREITKIIVEHGVDFQLTPDKQAELIGAGARPEVIEAIRTNYRPPSKKSAKNKPAEVNTTADIYQNLIDQALYQYNNSKNSNAAIADLQQAVKIDPNNSRAFQLLGFIYLYGLLNFSEAERNMREAINHGGSAVFRVFHDHNGTFAFGCTGSLYIAKDTVRYEADDNNHTFQTLDSDIKEIKTNGAWRKLIQVRAGSFKIVLKKGDDDKNFNFAPLTNKNEESKMIIRLIGK